jgi:hypothetical protein
MDGDVNPFIAATQAFHPVAKAVRKPELQC